eukprot:TRINITY_DN1058_c0_g1_i3.p2 TRINITY_DN1058_c0_g1~~TRINITY_DN1058_c0_g1_i3.p2  ORF type:complete len:266 (+),score=39.38 TRINITY_DN1058_c0_g1_i3:2733-3530(+)
MGVFCIHIFLIFPKKQNKKETKEKSNNKMTTPAGRTMLREVNCQIGDIQRSSGSCRFSQGGTEVICSMTGPIQAHDRASDNGKATIEVIIKGLDETTRAGQGSRLAMLQERYEDQLRTSSLSSLVRDSLSSMITLTNFPRQKFLFSIQVLSNDGSLPSVLVNAAVIAVLDSGVACNCVVAAVESCTVDGKLVIDPTSSELESSQSSGFFCHTCSDEPLVVSSKTLGVDMSADAFWTYHKATQTASKVMSELFRKFLKRQKGADTS